MEEQVSRYSNFLVKSYWEKRKDDSIMLATIHDNTWKVLKLQHITQTGKDVIIQKFLLLVKSVRSFPVSAFIYRYCSNTGCYCDENAPIRNDGIYTQVRYWHIPENESCPVTELTSVLLNSSPCCSVCAKNEWWSLNFLYYFMKTVVFIWKKNN